jgi:hypothetical protein
MNQISSWTKICGVDMLIASWKHQQSFPSYQWSWWNETLMLVPEADERGLAHLGPVCSVARPSDEHHRIHFRSWCADHIHGGPSSDADHGGSWRIYRHEHSKRQMILSDYKIAIIKNGLRYCVTWSSKELHKPNTSATYWRDMHEDIDNLSRDKISVSASVPVRTGWSRLCVLVLR